MIRTLKTLAAVSFGALLLTSAGCEDKESQEALKTCRNDLVNLQKSFATEGATVNSLKAQLAQAEAKVQEVTKESEAAKMGKGGKASEEKAKTAAATKAEPAQGEKKTAKQTK